MVRYRSLIIASRRGEKVPVFGGRGAHFLDYEHQVHLRMRTTRTEVPARASLLVSRMQPVPRQVCLAEGSEIMDHSDRVTMLSDILRNYFAPAAVDAIHKQAIRFTRFRRADQPAAEYIAEFDLLRQYAAPEV